MGADGGARQDVPTALGARKKKVFSKHKEEPA